jgi:uncharacterized membrane protein YadS
VTRIGCAHPEIGDQSAVGDSGLQLKTTMKGNEVVLESVVDLGLSALLISLLFVSLALLSCLSLQKP